MSVAEALLPFIRGLTPERPLALPALGRCGTFLSVASVIPSAPEPPPEKKPARAGDWTRALREAAPYLGLGMAMALTLAFGLWGGYWLDGRLGTQPLFLLLGGGLGMFAAFYHMIKTVSGRKK